VRLIKRISSPLLGLQVGQPSSFSLLPTSIKDRDYQIQEALGQVKAQQEDLLPCPWPPGRTAFLLLPPSYLNKDRDYQIQEAEGHIEAHQEDLLPSTWPPSRTDFRQQEATVRLIKKVSSSLSLQVGQPSSFSILPTLIKGAQA
jgi:hypothetical protein